MFSPPLAPDLTAGGRNRTDLQSTFIAMFIFRKRRNLHSLIFRPDMEPALLFAGDLTRQINEQQNSDRMPHLTTVDKRLIDMDEMGIDLQTIIPPALSGLLLAGT